MSRITKKLGNSPINYFSDLFVMAMVLAWIIVLIFALFAAVYATVKLNDLSLWSEVCTMAALPISVGGGIWMIKNSVQHAIANYKGKECPFDFPAVNADRQDDGFERMM